MPLKADDLKTVESYKKAIKLDLTRLSAQGNTKFWVYKDIELATAGGGKQKLPALLAFVDENAAKAVLKGKQPICSGLAGLKDGEVFFEANKGKVPYAVMKKTVPLLLGKPLHLPDGEDESEEDDEESGKLPSMPNAPTGTYARLNAAWKQLSVEANRYPGDHAQLNKLMDPIPDMLRSGKLTEAEKNLAQLHSMLKNPAASGSKAPGGDAKGEVKPVGGLVKYRTALLQFGQAKNQVKSQIANLRNAILKVVPEQKDFADDLAAELEEFNEELQDVVDEAMNAAKDEAKPANDAVRAKIRNYLIELQANSLVKKADANPLGVPVTIAKTLGLALQRIRESMPA